MRLLAVTVALIATVLASSSLSAQNKGCEETRNPKQLPPARDVLDSADAILELKESNLLADDMRFSLLFEGSDSFPRVRLLETTDPRAAMVLLRSIWPQKPSEPWAVRVHVVGGSTPSLTLERSIYCPPTPESGSAFPLLSLSRCDQGIADRHRGPSISGSASRHSSMKAVFRVTSGSHSLPV